MPGDKPCWWNGRRYPSQKIAADFCGVDFSAMSQRLTLGYRSDQDLYPAAGVPKPTAWNGEQFPSIRAAAKAAGVSKTTMRLWIASGKAGTLG